MVYIYSYFGRDTACTRIVLCWRFESSRILFFVDFFFLTLSSDVDNLVPNNENI